MEEEINGREFVSPPDWKELSMDERKRGKRGVISPRSRKEHAQLGNPVTEESKPHSENGYV